MNKRIIYTLALICAFSGFNLHAENAASIQEVAPIYPKTALERKLTGWVVVEYTVNENGRAENIAITDSEPYKVFDRAAVRAISKSKFEVAEVNGEPSKLADQRKKFVFEIDEEIPGSLAAN